MAKYPGNDVSIVRRPQVNDVIVPYSVMENVSEIWNSSASGNVTVGGIDEDNKASGLQDKSLGQILWIFVGPFIFVTGVIGNILVLAVMGRRRMQGTSTSVYLRLMALADFFVLIAGMIPEWLEQTDIIIFKKLHPATCKIEKFCFYTCADTSIWILMVFTIDRFIAVCFPLNKREYCLPSKTKFYAMGCFMAAVFKNFHVFWTRGAEFIIKDNTTLLKSNCGRPEPYRYFELFVRPWIAMSLVSFVPFIVIIICNIFIIRALLEVRRLRAEQNISSQSDKTLIQMTIMCLSASFAFLICVAPSIVILIGRPYWQDQSWYGVAKAINNQLNYVNHSVNFFLYCLTGRRFRHELMRMCKCTIPRKHGKGSSPNSSMAETTMYKVTNSKIANSPRPRLQHPPKTGNGITNANYSKLNAVGNHRLNAHRPVEVITEYAPTKTDMESVL